MTLPALLQAPPPSGFAELVASAFPFLVLLFISWLLLFRPMVKEKKEKQLMRESVKSGDRVLTIGGIHGTVTRMGERTLHVRVAAGVEIEFARTAIASIIEPDA